MSGVLNFRFLRQANTPKALYKKKPDGQFTLCNAFGVTVCLLSLPRVAQLLPHDAGSLLLYPAVSPPDAPLTFAW